MLVSAGTWQVRGQTVATSSPALCGFGVGSSGVAACTLAPCLASCALGALQSRVLIACTPLLLAVPPS